MLFNIVILCVIIGVLGYIAHNYVDWKTSLDCESEETYESLIISNGNGLCDICGKRDTSMLHNYGDKQVCHPCGTKEHYIAAKKLLLSSSWGYQKNLDNPNLFEKILNVLASKWAGKYKLFHFCANIVSDEADPLLSIRPDFCWHLVVSWSNGDIGAYLESFKTKKEAIQFCEDIGLIVELSSKQIMSHFGPIWPDPSSEFGKLKYDQAKNDIESCLI